MKPLIYGIGHDIVDIKRMNELVQGPLGSRFLKRILSDKEQVEASLRTAKAGEYVAGRFAAKEAVSKAFGCGIGHTIGFQDIEIIPDALGKPILHLAPEAWARLGMSAALYTIHLSITHERLMASAFVIVEKL
ncbi:holo-ACP synthase [Paenibacillus shirakamiensis]|uniref:holo-ACP synthase n=1 Tax=Paenibacillus shirakamiensis TaxID=1265935 RepID=UPI00315B141A